MGLACLRAGAIGYIRRRHLSVGSLGGRGVGGSGKKTTGALDDHSLAALSTPWPLLAGPLDDHSPSVLTDSLRMGADPQAPNRGRCRRRCSPPRPPATPLAAPSTPRARRRSHLGTIREVPCSVGAIACPTVVLKALRPLGESLSLERDCPSLSALSVGRGSGGRKKSNSGRVRRSRVDFSPVARLRDFGHPPAADRHSCAAKVGSGRSCRDLEHRLRGGSRCRQYGRSSKPEP